MSNPNIESSRRWFEEVWNERRDETIDELLSPMLVAQMEALGANPQKMAFSEVYGALQTGDVGPDMQTNASLGMTRWYQYYFFTHFNRGRLWEWGSDGMLRALNSDTSVLYDFTKKMQWYVFLSLKDPKFQGSYAEDDFLSTTVMGLNHFAQVIGQPSSGFQSCCGNQRVGETCVVALSEVAPEQTARRDDLVAAEAHCRTTR